MRTGVILITPSDSSEADLLAASLKQEGIPVLLRSRDDAHKTPEIVTRHIAVNRLKAIVISNTSSDLPRVPLQYAMDAAGLGRHAVGWVDLAPFLAGGLSERNIRQAHGMILVNVARLQRAEYARNAVLRAVARSPKISRRELFRSLPRVLRVESDIPIMLVDRCGDRSRSCNYCIQACPVKAVSAAPRGVLINSDLCIECGACARDCPIGAIQSPSISDSQIAAMINTLADAESETGRRALLLTCRIGFERLLDEGQKGRYLDLGVFPIQVPCVSFIGSSHYLWAASAGIPTVTVCPDTSCAKSAAMFPLFHHAASSRHLLKSTKEDKAALIRHLGLHANDSIVNVLSRAISPTSVTPESRVPEGSRQEITSEVIRVLRAHADLNVELPKDSTLSLFDLRVDNARCSLCELCKRACPDHAIEFTKEEDASTLLFNPSICGGCMICQRDCPEKAITVSRLIELSPILERKSVPRARDENAKCENCGASLGSKRSLAVLKNRLLEQGITEAATKTLNLCVRCKQSALIGPLAQHS